MFVLDLTTGPGRGGGDSAPTRLWAMVGTPGALPLPAGMMHSRGDAPGLYCPVHGVNPQTLHPREDLSYFMRKLGL